MDKNDIDRTLRNILHILQTDPVKYRCFGAWWWPIKALLKTRYTQDNLYMLGDYEDPDGAARVPDLGLVETVGSALEEFQRNAVFNLGSAEVIDPDGEPYTIYDEDAGI